MQAKTAKMGAGQEKGLCYIYSAATSRVNISSIQGFVAATKSDDVVYYCITAAQGVMVIVIQRLWRTKQ